MGVGGPDRAGHAMLDGVEDQLAVCRHGCGRFTNPGGRDGRAQEIYPASRVLAVIRSRHVMTGSTDSTIVCSTPSIRPHTLVAPYLITTTPTQTAVGAEERVRS